jgi:hypothetical protein
MIFINSKGKFFLRYMNFFVRNDDIYGGLLVFYSPLETQSPWFWAAFARVTVTCFVKKGNQVKTEVGKQT